MPSHAVTIVATSCSLKARDSSGWITGRISSDFENGGNDSTEGQDCFLYTDVADVTADCQTVSPEV